MSKTPDLSSLREREQFLLSPPGLRCLQLKKIHRPKWHILGTPVLIPFNSYLTLKFTMWNMRFSVSFFSTLASTFAFTALAVTSHMVPLNCKVLENTTLLYSWKEKSLERPPKKLTFPEFSYLCQTQCQATYMHYYFLIITAVWHCY